MYYMKIRSFDLLVWGSLRLIPNMHLNFCLPGSAGKTEIMAFWPTNGLRRDLCAFNSQNLTG